MESKHYCNCGYGKEIHQRTTSSFKPVEIHSDGTCIYCGFYAYYSAFPLNKRFNSFSDPRLVSIYYKVFHAGRRRNFGDPKKLAHRAVELASKDKDFNVDKFISTKFDDFQSPTKIEQKPVSSMEVVEFIDDFGIYDDPPMESLRNCW